MHTAEAAAAPAAAPTAAPGTFWHFFFQNNQTHLAQTHLAFSDLLRILDGSYRADHICLGSIEFRKFLFTQSNGCIKGPVVLPQLFLQVGDLSIELRSLRYWRFPKNFPFPFPAVWNNNRIPVPFPVRGPRINRIPFPAPLRPKNNIRIPVPFPARGPRINKIPFPAPPWQNKA